MQDQNQSPIEVTDPPVVNVEDSVTPSPGETGEATPPNPRLIVKRAGVETEEVFPFVAPALIGRFDPEVGPIDIDLGNISEGGYVSRKHAKIVLEDGIYRIQDLGSSNGTYLLWEGDFKKVDDAELQDGDEIALGNARFIFRLTESSVTQ
ncbi:MAG: FHA domain-containing protein [Fimbriimonadaceae bacterium]|jgi:hypothetical protein|nr:FHA domain-containing protein [Fimbriimonadaceae bacterium]